MCIEFALKKGGIGILKNFMYSTKSVLKYIKKLFTYGLIKKIQSRL
jgi:hypothetical protein